MPKRGSLPSLFGIALLASPVLGAGESSLPELSLHGLFDARYLESQAQDGWAEGGLGKLREGGEVGRPRINEGALVVQGRLWEWAGTLTLKYADGQKNPLDPSEVFLSYHPASTSPWRFGARLGAFFPPISLENTGTAWSSPYTLGSSAINTWVGEELRTFGGEAQLNYRFDGGDRVGVFAAGFGHNDTAGALLAWRGFALHDYEATLNDSLPLPEGIGIPAAFPLQAGRTRPFVEVDGRPGYYLGLAAERRDRYKFRALYYDNRADPEAIERGQYAWYTRFLSLGLKAELPWEVTLIGQGLSGRTRMGERRDGRRAVDVGFWAASLLLSKSLGSHRLSLRHDRFGTDEDDHLPEDANREHGYAFTANYNYTFAQRHQFNLEVSHIVSDRPARERLDQASLQEETLWQIAYRLFY
jgi:hypothetical protein